MTPHGDDLAESTALDLKRGQDIYARRYGPSKDKYPYTRSFQKRDALRMYIYVAW